MVSRPRPSLDVFPPLSIPPSSWRPSTDILESSFAEPTRGTLAPSREILTRLLTTKIKPAFQGSPHPQLNTSTGRKLPRQAGGAMAGQDFYEEQVWKADASAVALVGWCARHMDVSRRSDFLDSLHNV